ncbi:MAG: thioredoxin family protein [Anaeroplasmataceae bacterium]|nr:thioredoxin family protein [Anaeroplasmataceae bacterium]MDE5867683.1 thioredoxin family protein [Anaeroplasmataceae bacterium]
MNVLVYEYNGLELQDGLYFFYASWNSACNVLKERISRINNEFPQINIYRVNTTKYSNLKQQLKVNRIPSYLWIKNQVIEGRRDGNVDYFTLKKWLQERV